MAQNIVDVSFNIPKFDEDRELLKAKMMETYNFLKTQSANLIPIGAGSWQEVTKAMNDQAAALEKTAKANLVAAKQIAQVEKNNILAAKAATESAKATQAQEKAEQQRLKTQQIQLDLTKKQTAANEAAAASTKGSYNVADVPFVINSPNKDELSGATTLINEMDQAQAAAAMSAAEFGNSVNKSTAAMETNAAVGKGTVVVDKELEAAKLALVKANSEENVTLQGYKLQTQAANKAAKEQAKVTLDMLGPYELLNKQYIEAKINAQNLAVQYGVNSVEAKTAAATALELNTKLQAIDKTVGLSQRNVGNYPGAFDKAAKAATGFYSVLRKVAYIIPGIGIAGLIGLLIDPIISATKALFGFGEVSEKVKQQQEEIASAYKDAAEAVGQEISKVTVLKTVLESENASRLQKITALKELKAVNADYFGQLDLENGKVVGLGNAYDMYVSKLIRSINAKANINQLTQALKAQNDIVADINKNGQYLEKHTAANLTDYEVFNAISEFNLDFGKGKTSAKVLGGKELQLIADLLNAKDRVKQITDSIKGDVQDAFEPKPGKDHSAKVATVMESTKDALDLEFELYKISQQRKLNLLDEEVNDTKRSLMERVLLAEQYRDASIELSDRTAQHEIDLDKKKMEALQDNYKKAKGTQKNNIEVDIKNTAAQIVITETKANNARKDAAEKFNKEYIQIVKDTEEQRLKAFKDAENAIKNIRQEQQSAIDAGEATELGALNTLYDKKLVTQKEYNKKKAKLENDALILSLESQIQETKGLRDVEKLMGNSTIEYDNKITELTGKLQTAQNKAPDKKSPNDLLDSVEKATQGVLSAINGLVDIGYQKQIDAIQKIIDLNNQRKEQEVANINASTLSNQEKAAQQILLDKTVAANNEKLQREQVALKQKQAKFDRDMAILSIIEQATIAEFKLPAQGGFAGLAAGLAIGIAAAGEIAMLMAKPLPQYGEGTENHPGGGAIVGEKKVNGSYQKELVTFPGGGTYLTSGPTLFGDLPKGSRVTPITKDVINQAMYNAMIQGTAERLQSAERQIKDDAIIEAIKEGSIMTVRAMKKQKGTNVVVNVNSEWGAYIRKNVIE